MIILYIINTLPNSVIIGIFAPLKEPLTGLFSGFGFSFGASAGTLPPEVSGRDVTSPMVVVGLSSGGLSDLDVTPGSTALPFCAAAIDAISLFTLVSASLNVIATETKKQNDMKQKYQYGGGIKEKEKQL